MLTKTDNVGVPAKTPPVSIVEMDEVHLNQVLTLFDECLGRGYIIPAQLREYSCTSGGQKKGFVALLAEKVVGAVTCLAVPPEEIEAASLIPLDMLKKFVPQVLLVGKIGLVKSIVVYKRYRRQGIGAALLISALQWLKEVGVVSSICDRLGIG